ncbi:hypothetical protein PAXRUDRAFT_824473 [Paxillus rubicundulus Ve08.2h10]|uniref:Uncharacterized protein n=1 Tax=Paxillus rubicundulus Ve08.2h10 TaxID=930991 RepID=A0A0D0DHX9_9AGAM|nr:hypothetical protein PAXRUDRAFT_824473 [Paxillus rubicundulus Ve08.2h10]
MSDHSLGVLRHGSRFVCVYNLHIDQNMMTMTDDAVMQNMADVHFLQGGGVGSRLAQIRCGSFSLQFQCNQEYQISATTLRKLHSERDPSAEQESGRRTTLPTSCG